MLGSRVVIGVFILFAGALFCPPTADAQIDRIRRAAQRELEKQAKKMIGDAVACSLDDTACVEQAKKDGEKVVIVDDDGEVITDENGNPISDPEEAKARSEEPGEGIWRNYDFTPGTVVWKATDFSDEPVGRFPASQLEFVSGNMEIVEMNGERVLETSASSVFRVRLPEALPEDFTLEFYQQIAAPNIATTIYFTPMETANSRYEYQYLILRQRSGIHFQGNVVSELDGFREMNQAMTPVKFQVDGDYAILYIGTERAANIPTANFGSADFIEFRVGGNRNLRSYISDIVVAVGVDDLYDTLMETGEFTTRGIYFDTDSDVLRPESTPVLEEMLTTLSTHEDLEILIEGHTDDTGEDAHNLDLSERRAQSVVSYLTRNGIDPDRLDAVGMGETQPFADNSTPEGRKQNRRVVLRVKEG
ncbi:MAG: OmpA family protein [Gemmatimonadetes bacterium]|nr:OmpA family protein [Gemmatimonadota bacterium]